LVLEGKNDKIKEAVENIHSKDGDEDTAYLLTQEQTIINSILENNGDFLLIL
jgi:hypothetical protein